MFRRVTPEDWSQLTALAGFALTFLVFLVALIKAWRMTRETAHYMAARPLEMDAIEARDNQPASHHE